MAAAPLQFTLPDLCSASLQSFLLRFLCWHERSATSFSSSYTRGLTNTQTEKLWPDLLSHAIIVNNIWSPKTRLNCFVAVSSSVSHTWLLKWQHTVINPSLSLQWEKPDIIVHSWLIMSFLSLYINSCHARWNAGSLCYFLWNIKNNHLWIICNLAALKYSIYYNYYIYYNISVMLSLQQVCNYITPSLMQKKNKIWDTMWFLLLTSWPLVSASVGIPSGHTDCLNCAHCTKNINQQLYSTVYHYNSLIL